MAEKREKLSKSAEVQNPGRELTLNGSSNSTSGDGENLSNRTRVITAVDLFSGAGGFSLGAIRAGVNVVGAVEHNKSAAQTYAANIKQIDGGAVPVITESIVSADPHEAMKAWKIEVGGCDIVVGGPPCQGFSAHRTNDSGVDDPRNELLCRYFEYVKAIRPRVFLVENVPGLLWERHAPYLKKFYAMAEEANYEVRVPVTLNARDYGVPQNRKRVFLLGIDRNRPLTIEWPPAPTHADPATTSVANGLLKPWSCMQDVFLPALAEDPNNIHMNHSLEMIELFRKTPKNGGSRSESGRVLKCHEGHSGHKDVYGRIDPSKPGPTMTTACINPSKGRFVHPVEDHGITVRQAARIQTFPDAFHFSGGLIAAGVQIGNAVPVMLAEALIKPLVESILSDL